MESLNGLKIIRLKPEKDDSDTQSAVNHMISEGSREILIFGATGTRLDHVLANLGLLFYGKSKRSSYRTCRSVELHYPGRQWNSFEKKRRTVWKICFFLYSWRDVSGLTLKGFQISSGWI